MFSLGFTHTHRHAHSYTHTHAPIDTAHVISTTRGNSWEEATPTRKSQKTLLLFGASSVTYCISNWLKIHQLKQKENNAGIRGLFSVHFSHFTPVSLLFSSFWVLGINYIFTAFSSPACRKMENVCSLQLEMNVDLMCRWYIHLLLL